MSIDALCTIREELKDLRNNISERVRGSGWIVKIFETAILGI